LPVQAGAVPLGRLIVLRDVTDERAVERMRRDMTHTMVHDLRSPLSSIFGAAELMAMDQDTLAANQVATLEIIRKNTRKMLDLVNSILDVSRLESGRMPVKREQFELERLVNEIFQMQSTLAQEAAIRLENNVPLTLPAAWADSNLIGRVLQNLIGNAIKFTPPGGTISVSGKVEDQPGAPVIIVSVSDTGPGIPPEIQNRLFQKFVTGAQKGRGSGLGLAFCKLAVEAHGERIWVDSTSGRGTTFAFTLATRWA
jgi:signal transduction histidine kinase